MQHGSFPPFPESFDDRLAWLDEAAVATEDEFRRWRSRSLGWSWARLLTFAAIPAGLYLYFARTDVWGLGLSLGGAILFLLAIRFHGRARAAARTSHLLKQMIAESHRRMTDGVTIVRTGRRCEHEPTWESLIRRLDAATPAHSLSPQEIEDFDLFGEPLSLYGLLNRTSSSAGAARLASVICHPLARVGDIRRRQDAVRWLARHAAARLRLMAAAAALRPLQAECGRLYETIREATPLPLGAGATVMRLWGLAAPVALGLGLAQAFGWQAHLGGWIPLVAVILLNAVLMQLFLKPMRERVRPWLQLDQIVERMGYFCRTAAGVLPDDDLLGDQRHRLRLAMAPGRWPSLERTLPFLFLGLSGIFHTIIDVLVFWDLQVLGRMERCYIRHRKTLLDVFAALAECELLCSLACFAAEEPDTVWPTFVEGPCRLYIDSGRHPLIAPDEAVPNSLDLNETTATWIITGSNMSGKSTFLRMAGLAALLAQIGSAATARRVSLTPMALLSDLRIRDDLSRQESYFLAEVRQVRRMIDAVAAGEPVFVLIDEPFRGTNSGERIAAANAVVEALIAGSGVHLVATHDAALVPLGNRPGAANHHFQESFAASRLVFDHLLRDGPAKSRNALHVMEAEGYPRALVARARERLGELDQTAAFAPPDRRGS